MWRTEEEQWVHSGEIKHLDPIEVADYAHAYSLVDEPAFKWWVPFTLQRQDHIDEILTH